MLGRRNVVGALISVALTLAVLGQPALAQGPQGAGGPPHAVIVVLKDNVQNPQQVANEHAQQHGATISFVYEFALKGYAATIPANALAGIARDPRVQFISEDREVQAVAQTLPTGVDRIQGDSSSARSGDGTGSVNVAVAVIDTGSGPHSDLNIAGGKNCSTGNPNNYGDGNGHGTHVAGTIAAKDDGAGVVGVVPGAQIYSVRVLNNAGSGSWSSVICGINWVTGNAASLGITVASMSLGGGGSDDGNCGNSNSDALHKAICGSVTAGVTYVVAAGNDGANFSGFVPAAYDEVLTVTAVADYDGQSGSAAAFSCANYGADDSAASFSNYATSAADQAHTIAAPGACILSTWKSGGYNTISGTSMATPHVSGTAALCIFAGNCTGSPAAIIQTLRTDAAAQPPSYGFANDPSHAIGASRYYGYLVHAGGY
jgi:subtilisin